MKTLQEVFLLEPELVNFLQKMDFLIEDIMVTRMGF